MEGQRRRVLVVDDDLKLGALVARVLASEHDVLVMTSARQALDHIARRKQFDLVLCDLMLPGMSGIDFHERLCLTAPDLAGRVLFVTGGASSPRAEAFLMRADIRHIEKPFASIADLRARVREEIARAVKARPP